MITLASSTGSSSYEIGDLAFPPDEEERIFFNAVQLLEAQGERRAAQILRSFGFHIHQGINDFADEFMVLHAELPLPQYVDIKKRMESDWTSEFVGDVKRIQETLSDLDLYVRFVSCALKREEPPPTWREEDASSSDMGSRKNYALDPRPIGRGGYAEVFRARHKKSGVVVAFKRALDNDEDSAARLRREIEEQSKLVHPHVMPILDHSKTFGWFTMPCAMGDLEKLRPELDDAMLVEMLDQAAQGLAAAHALGLVHRDVTPRNILALAENDGIRRWVVADWGLVRRPRGMTTVPRTATRQTFGTDGFAAPELWDDAHAAGPEADVYGLGRVAAWAATGEWPKPNMPLEPVGVWRHLVRSTTHLERAQRVSTMGVFRKLLAELREGGAATEKTAIERAIEIQKAVARGADPAVQALVSLALAHPEEADLYIIHLPRMPLNSVMALVRSRPSEVKSLLASMLALLSGADWRGRSFDLANGPLHWFETVARCAAQVGNDGLLEDAASCLFDAEARWQRFAQRRLTRAWLEAIDAGDAQTVARALRRHPSAAKWYSDEGWRPQSAHSLIRRALAEGIGASKADKS